jgi:hypothetical protein
MESGFSSAHAEIAIEMMTYAVAVLAAKHASKLMELESLKSRLSEHPKECQTCDTQKWRYLPQCDNGHMVHEHPSHQWADGTWHYFPQGES